MDPIVILFFFLLFCFVLVFLYSIIIRPIFNYNFYYMNDNGFLAVENAGHRRDMGGHYFLSGKRYALDNKPPMMTSSISK